MVGVDLVQCGFVTSVNSCKRGGLFRFLHKRVPYPLLPPDAVGDVLKPRGLSV